MPQSYMISTGRGGAGNIHRADTKASPKIIPEGSETPSILSPVYSTGRGGAGNMRRNINPKITRKAQDVGDLPSDDEDLDMIIDEDTKSMKKKAGHHKHINKGDDDDVDTIHNEDTFVDDDDFITPITNEDLFENSKNNLTNALSKVKSHLSPVASPLDHLHSNNLTTAKSNASHPKIKLVAPLQKGPNKDLEKKKKKRLSMSYAGNPNDKIITIGRGGAGNIVSPSNSRGAKMKAIDSKIREDKQSSNNETSTNSNNSGNTPDDNGNISKKGFFASIFGIFS